MTTSYFDQRQKRSYRIDLRRWSLLTLLAAAGLVVGVAIAESDFFNDDSDARTTADAPPPVSVPESGASGASIPAERGPLTLQDAMDLTRQSRAAMQEIRDYTATFYKRERIKGRLRKQVMEMKLRAEPFSVYLLYQSKKEAGRQAVYVAGAHDDCLLCRDVGIKGLAGTLRLGLANALVMSENRYPVTHLGMANVIETVLTAWDREAKLNGIRPLVEIVPDVRLGEVPCRELRVTHPQPHPELEFHLTRVFFEQETMLPIHAERYGWPEQTGEEPPLFEEYIYQDVKTNVGLTDADFDPAHYGF